MPRYLSWTLVALVGLVSAVPVRGDEPVRTFFRNMGRDFKRNNCWYDTFVAEDRAVQRAPFCVMVSNGWRLQNTLDDYYFQQDSSVLTEAGQIKVQQIVLYSSPAYRAIFVHRTTDALDDGRADSECADGSREVCPGWRSADSGRDVHSSPRLAGGTDQRRLQSLSRDDAQSTLSVVVGLVGRLVRRFFERIIWIERLRKRFRQLVVDHCPIKIPAIGDFTFARLAA